MTTGIENRTRSSRAKYTLRATGWLHLTRSNYVGWRARRLGLAMRRLGVTGTIEITAGAE